MAAAAEAVTEAHSPTAAPKSDAERRKGRVDMVSFDQLEPDPENVRREPSKKRSPVEYAEFKENIAREGIVSALTTRVVRPGVYAVMAGETRWKIIGELIEEGRWSREARDIPILIKDREGWHAGAISLAENIHRVGMHPADEFGAFLNQAKGGDSAEDIAARHGKSVAEVRKLLRLGEVHPTILKAFRNGMTFDVLRAYARLDDPKAQKAVFDGLGEQQRVHAHTVTQAIRQSAASTEDPLFRFVGMEAYREAGGRTSEDLFGDTTNLLDGELIVQLARARLDEAARAAGEWKWKQVGFPHELDSLYSFTQLRTFKVEPTPELADALAKAKGAVAKAVERKKAAKGKSEKVMANAANAHREATGEEERIKRRIDRDCRVYSERTRKNSGCVVTWERHTGELLVVGALLTPKEAKEAERAKAKGKSKGEAANDEGASEAASERSAPFRDHLSRLRRSCVRLHVARNPQVARTLADLHLCMEGLGSYGSPLVLSGTLPSDTQNDAKAEPNPVEATREAMLDEFDGPEVRAFIDAAEAALYRSRGGTLDELYGKFAVIGEEERAALLAWCVARCMCVGSAGFVLGEGEHEDVPSALREALGTDNASVYRPQRDLLKRFSRTELLAVGVEVCGEAFAEDYAKATKGKMLDRIDAVLNGEETETLSDHELKSRREWLPRELHLI